MDDAIKTKEPQEFCLKEIEIRMTVVNFNNLKYLITQINLRNNEKVTRSENVIKSRDHVLLGEKKWLLGTGHILQ